MMDVINYDRFIGIIPLFFKMINENSNLDLYFCINNFSNIGHIIEIIGHLFENVGHIFEKYAYVYKKIQL